ncbi:MAG: 3-deoxy-manno-octulosonate cytidylyltransferase [Fimbriimonadaceae bacterium]|nr:3-deoxy-manno-octulosonate cytidylyltransferase [Fimbriimonadaceae bacterium]
MKLAIVIPARMASTRFPGKPLCDLLGRPMIAWVYERACAAEVTDNVLVATPDPEIETVCANLGIPAVRTRLDHPSGTDRIAEVAETHPADVFVNLQGDEPLVRPDTIRACVRPFLAGEPVEMASVCAPAAANELENPAVVKVVTDLAGYALYFSRWCLPFPRSDRPEPVKKHIGLYAYTRDVLRRFATWPPSPLERAESLEQLRFLENGVRIKMEFGQGSEMAIDTPEQADIVRSILTRGDVLA